MDQSKPIAQVTAFVRENPYVEYIIKVGDKDDTARMRFSQFVSLREDILPLWQNAPGLPSRVYDTSPESRLPQLNDFLQQVCETLATQPPSPLLRFLGVDSTTFASARSLNVAVEKVSVDVGTYKTPVQFEAEIERVIREIILVSNVKDDEDGWKVIGRQSPFTWMARPEDAGKGQSANRVAFGELKRCTPRLIHELMLSNDACKEMESKIDTLTDVVRLDEHTFVQHFVMKSIMYMPPRDVILVRHWRVLPDQTVVHAEFSLDDYPGVPPAESNNRVRARLTCGGVVLKSAEGDPTSCRIWRVNNMDPRLGDAIPAYALAKLNEFTASMLSSNMFCLAKLVSKSNLQSELAKGPLVNWNGMVHKPDISENSDVDYDKKLPSTVEQGSTVVPYVVGFAIGFVTAATAFAAEKFSAHN